MQRSSATCAVDFGKRHDTHPPATKTVSDRVSGGLSGDGGLSVTLRPVTAVLIGYARCSTDKQDLEANRQILLDLGVPTERIYLDRAYSGTLMPAPVAPVRPACRFGSRAATSRHTSSWDMERPAGAV